MDKKKFYTLDEVRDLYIGDKGTFEREKFEEDLIKESSKDRETINWEIFNGAAEKYADLPVVKQLNKRREDCYRQGITPDEYIAMWEEQYEMNFNGLLRELLLTI